MIYTINKNGSDITLPLAKYVKNQKRALIFKKVIVLKLFKKNNLFIASCFDSVKKIFFNIISKAVIIATGGGAQMYQITRNPKDATGDGFILAYQIGAELIDMEFILYEKLLKWVPESVNRLYEDKDGNG